ncbi:MAG: hypothetical protein ACFB00_12445, partial [Parvularculaceae bacterium]
MKNENNPPYARFGDGAPANPDDFWPGPLPSDDFELTVRVFSGGSGAGQQLAEAVYDLAVGAGSGGPVDPPTPPGGSGVSAAYVYDGNYKRVKQTTNGATIYSVYSQSGVLLHRDAVN